jgi:hypothetical protein
VFVSWHPPDPYSYSCILGLYLGDGCVSVKARGSAQIVVSWDADYPGLIEDCVTAIRLVTLGTHVMHHRVKDQRCVRVLCAWKHWPTALPQHGAGRKH